MYIRSKSLHQKTLRQAKLNFNASYISNSANGCKAAWGIINSTRKNNVSRVDITFGPDDFNAYIIDSMEHILNSLDSDNSLGGSILSLENSNLSGNVFEGD